MSDDTNERFMEPVYEFVNENENDDSDFHVDVAYVIRFCLEILEDEDIISYDEDLSIDQHLTLIGESTVLPLFLREFWLNVAREQGAIF